MTLEEVVGRLRAELLAASSFWEVEVRPGFAGRVHVVCGHPASAGFVIDVDPNDATHVAGVLAFTELDEVRIASAAPPLQHPDRVESLRTLIKAFKWTQPEVTGLAFVLFEHGFLTADETAWMAGYTSVDAPMRPEPPI